MTPHYEKKLKAKIASLAAKLSQLQAKREEIAERRCSSTTADQKRKCSGEAGAVSAAMIDVQRDLDAAKRLLARGEGDEYAFVTR